MEITKLQLYSYRNYLKSEVDFKGGLNIIYGKNAQGKTNLLEAVYFCAVGKSFRASREKEVINLNSEISKIKLYVKKDIGSSVIEIIFSRKQKKTIKINGIPIKKISELLGEFNAVFFSPDELKLIKESPEDRRRFMDIDISQTSKQYFYLLSRYNEVLQNRNKQLKMNVPITDLKKIMKIWNEQLADCAIKIAKYRQNFVLTLEPFAKQAHSYLTNNKEDLEIEYVGIKENTKNEIIEKLESCLEKDLSLGYTSYGPHRDDIKVSINGIDVRIFGSQGQQRTSALSLKLAEVSIIENQIHSKPVLLLDDVLSELDEERKIKLIEYCQNVQTLITCTGFDYKINYNGIEISNGNVVQNKIIKI